MRRAMAVVCGLSFTACGCLHSPPRLAATAELKSSDGRSLGAIRLTERADGVAIEGQLTTVPAGIHAIHIHLVGKCDPPMFESADEHFNPTGAQHGSKNTKGPPLRRSSKRQCPPDRDVGTGHQGCKRLRSVQGSAACSTPTVHRW